MILPKSAADLCSDPHCDRTILPHMRHDYPPFVSSMLTFTRQPGTLTLNSDGSEWIQGDNWRCDLCRMLLKIEETPRAHANAHHMTA